MSFNLPNFRKKVKVIKASQEKFNDQLTDLLRFPNVNRHQPLPDSLHFQYLAHYLFHEPKGLQIKTMVEENDYLSMSYLGDYLNYYAHCYKKYDKLCKRIHFFQEEFSEEIFIKMLTGGPDDYKEYWNSYAGHIVVRPLPNGMIGASLIKPYDKLRENRFYTAIREYTVNLFGKNLTINTMPYIEQDGVVGMCASSALWFAFHKTAELFKNYIPNPSDITLSAGADGNNSGMDFPNSGLDIAQIGKAISSLSLVADLTDYLGVLQRDKWLKALIYAYSRMGIPVLLGLAMEKHSNHLVTINGFRFGEDTSGDPMAGQNDTDEPGEIALVSDAITKFYAHDDQVGPFARLDFLKAKDRSRLPRERKQKIKNQFKTAWWANPKSKVLLDAYAMAVIVPLQKSIKVKFQTVFDQIMVLDLSLDVLNEHLHELIIGNLTWDIFLCDGEQYKSELLAYWKIKGQTSLPNAANALFASLPEHVWVAKAFLQKGNDMDICFEILYDAADVDVLNAPFLTNFYDRTTYASFKDRKILDDNDNFQIALYDYLKKSNDVLDDINRSPKSHEIDPSKALDAVNSLLEDLGNIDPKSIANPTNQAIETQEKEADDSLKYDVERKNIRRPKPEQENKSRPKKENLRQQKNEGRESVKKQGLTIKANPVKKGPSNKKKTAQAKKRKL